MSVLFCDLAGFTTLSEGRDAEDVRELLSRYFELARAVVDRYGGTIEKFIGDAVMAAWGVPTANEDDAERAVRAGLELVAGVAELGTRSNLAGLAARAGVLTGDAAVTLGASGQGMIAGDLVNSASRLQSVAEPGTVLVGEATYFSARDAVAFEDQRDLSVKGKDLPISAWRAVRVVAQRRGAGRSTQLEPPFVGREEQLRLLRPPPWDRARAEGPVRLRHRDRRDREEQARVGAPQVRGRPRRDRLLAPRALPRLRRGDHVLGAGRDGAHAGADQRARRRRDGATEAGGGAGGAYRAA